MMRHISSVIESDESGDESEPELEEQIGMMSLLSSPSRDENASPGRRKIRSSIMPNNNRRTTKVEDDTEADDNFAFLSDWASMKGDDKKW